MSLSHSGSETMWNHFVSDQSSCGVTKAKIVFNGDKTIESRQAILDNKDIYNTIYLTIES